MDRKEALEKVRKLAELANPESNAFEGEIANASALMQKLMDKFSITPEELIDAENKVIDEKFAECSADVMLGSIQYWNWILARLIARITHTRHFSSGKSTFDPTTGKFAGMKTLKGVTRERGKTISFYGKESNAEIASQLYTEWIIRLNLAARAATAEYCKELLQNNPSYRNAYHIPNLGDDHPNVFRASWLDGCLRAMNASVREQEEKRDTNTSSALVVYNANLAAKWEQYSKHMRGAKIGGGSGFNAAGHLRGQAAGANMHIGQKSIGGRNKQLHD